MKKIMIAICAVVVLVAAGFIILQNKKTSDDITLPDTGEYVDTNLQEISNTFPFIKSILANNTSYQYEINYAKDKVLNSAKFDEIKCKKDLDTCIKDFESYFQDVTIKSEYHKGAFDYSITCQYKGYSCKVIIRKNKKDEGYLATVTLARER